MTYDLFTVVCSVHTLQHFFLATIGRFLTLEWFSTTHWPVLWMCVPYLRRYGPFKNRPSVGGSCGGASLFTGNMKFEPLSLLLTSTQSLYFCTRNSWIYSVNENIKRFAEIKNLDLLYFSCSPKSERFPSRRQSYHSWWENMKVKERNWD